MRTSRLFCLISVGTAGLLTVAGFAPPSDGQFVSAENSSGRILTSAESTIVRHPFPSSAASQRLLQKLNEREQERRRRESLPEAQRPSLPDNGGMGWAVSDDEYWRQIPVEARAIPTTWEPFPAVRFTNTQLGGEREIRLSVQGDYDLWLLHDPLHNLTACISVQRATRRVWFMEITRQANGAWVAKRAKDHCYSCHPSGPRVIRPLDEPGLDRHQLARFNRRLLSYGACDFGDSIDRKTQGALAADARCSGCHNGTNRGKLYAIHQRPIHFKTEQDATMPPDE